MGRLVRRRSPRATQPKGDSAIPARCRNVHLKGVGGRVDQRDTDAGSAAKLVATYLNERGLLPRGRPPHGNQAAQDAAVEPQARGRRPYQPCHLGEVLFRETIAVNANGAVMDSVAFEWPRRSRPARRSPRRRPDARPTTTSPARSPVPPRPRRYVGTDAHRRSRTAYRNPVMQRLLTAAADTNLH